MMLNDDVLAESETLRAYHVQDPAQTNAKDLIGSGPSQGVISCYGEVDQIYKRF